MRQTLHIFRKDVHYLRREIALVLLLAAAFAVLHVPRLLLANNSWLAELAFVATAAFLIGRLILAEPIPGDRQFWITRPYRWRSLLGAKILCIVTFVNLPLLLAQLFIVASDGFPLLASLPGLLWEQVLLFTFVALPCAALASLNGSMAAFIFSELVVVAAAAGLWDTPVRLPAALLGGVDWVRDSVAALALACVAVPVLLVQYRSRRTIFSRCLAAGGFAVGAVLFAALPSPFALGVQSHLSKDPVIAQSIHAALVEPIQQPLWQAGTNLQDAKVALTLRVALQGAPQGTEMKPDGLTVSLRAPDGNSVNFGIADCPELHRETISPLEPTIVAVCRADPAFFHRERGKPVTIRGSLYLTLFGNERSQTIPLTNQPSNALDGLQCYTDVVKAEWDVYCRSAFRWPSRLIFAKLGHTNANSFTQTVSYSPFPATLEIEPVETRWASGFAASIRPNVRDVTIIVKEPLAHFRRDFAAGNVPLDDFDPAWFKYRTKHPIQ
jgi:hypothetical protein